MDKITEQAANAVLAATVNDGGCTFEGRTLLPFTPSVGYAVAQGGAVLSPTDVTPESLAFVAKAVVGEYNTTYAGTWLAEGRFYIDAVHYVLDREAAISLGREFGQVAIYDFAAKQEVTL